MNRSTCLSRTRPVTMVGTVPEGYEHYYDEFGRRRSDPALTELPTPKSPLCDPRAVSEPNGTITMAVAAAPAAPQQLLMSPPPTPRHLQHNLNAPSPQPLQGQGQQQHAFPLPPLPPPPMQSSKSLEVAPVALPGTVAALIIPPPRPKSRPEKISVKLRSTSGLSMHTNELALRQYTDYNPDGSPRSPLFGGGGEGSGWRKPGERLTSLDSHLSSDAGSGGVDLMGTPDFLGRDTFQMALNNPTTCYRLLRYAHTQGMGENVEFLLKLQEYSRSLETVTSLLGQISSSYTGFAASSPLTFPPVLAKSLSTDIKSVSVTVLPGLEMLFHEAQDFIQQKVYRDIYPGFVRHQLGLTTRLSLCSNPSPPSTSYGSTHGSIGGSASGASFASSSMQSGDSGYSTLIAPEFPGLGDCFCITDPNLGDNRITHISDGFAAVTGYSRRETLRNCRFLQGPQTDKAAVTRIRNAIQQKEECVELLLNYRKDGQPFWNLLYVTPLVDAQTGKVRFFLGGQINVSDTVGCNKDVLRVLNAGATRQGEVTAPPPLSTLPLPPFSPPSDMAEDEGGDWGRVRAERGGSLTLKNAMTGGMGAMGAGAGSVFTYVTGAGGERQGQHLPNLAHQHMLRGKEAGASKSSRFFKSFTRKPTSTPGTNGHPYDRISPPSTSSGNSNGNSSKEDRRRSYHESNKVGTTGGLEPFLLQRSLQERQGLQGQMDSFYTAYSSFLVLEYQAPPGSPESSSFMSHSTSNTSYTTTTSSSPSGYGGGKKGGSGSGGMPQMVVAFHSPGALGLLGLQPGGVERQDIFGVLEGVAAGGLGKGFRNTVTGRVREGMAVCAEMTVGRVEWQPQQGNGGDTGGACDVRGRGRKGSIIERMNGTHHGWGDYGGESYLGGGGGRSTSGGGGGSMKKVLEKVVSYWTPLKDDAGKIGWVILVITKVGN